MTVPGPYGSTLTITVTLRAGTSDATVIDVSDRVLNATGIVVQRGRSSQLDRFQAGSASFTLDNSDRYLDPSYTAGPYYGDLLPLSGVTITAAYNAVSYPIFTGWLLGFPQVHYMADNVLTVPVRCVDAFGLLALASGLDNQFVLDDASLGVLDVSRLGGDPGAVIDELSGARITRLLDMAGWPAADRDIATGLSTVGNDLSAGSLLPQAQTVEESEDGFLYPDREGNVVFLDRHARQTLARMATSQATFTDDGGGLGYAAHGWDWSADQVFNDVRLTGVSDNEQGVSDGPSIDLYRRRTLAATVANVTDAEVRDIATLKLWRYKDPVRTTPVFEVRPGGDPANLFPAVLGREVLDRVTVERTPMGIGNTVTDELIVEGISHRFDSVEWVTGLTLSPGFIEAWFVLNDATLGVLDDDRLAG